MNTDNKIAGMAPVYKDWRDALVAVENYLIETTCSFMKANQRLRDNNLQTEDDYGCTLTYAEILGGLHDVRMALDAEIEDLTKPASAPGSHGESAIGMMATPMGGSMNGTRLYMN